MEHVVAGTAVELEPPLEIEVRDGRPEQLFEVAVDPEVLARALQDLLHGFR